MCLCVLTSVIGLKTREINSNQQNKQVVFQPVVAKPKINLTWLRPTLPCLASDACFSALGTSCIFHRAWHRLHFPRLAPVVYFTALGTGYMFSCAWHRLHVFPRLALVSCFPALGTSCMFSRAWHSHIGRTVTERLSWLR